MGSCLRRNDSQPPCSRRSNAAATMSARPSVAVSPASSGGTQPARLGQFIIELRFARNPPRRKSENNEVALDAILGVPHDHFAVAGQRHRLDCKLGLFAHLADDRFNERLAGLDTAAGQREQSMRRSACPAHHENVAVANDGGADREIGAIRIGSWVRHESPLQERVDGRLRRAGGRPGVAQRQAVDHSARPRHQRLEIRRGFPRQRREHFGRNVELQGRTGLQQDGVSGN